MLIMAALGAALFVVINRYVVGAAAYCHARRDAKRRAILTRRRNGGAIGAPSTASAPEIARARASARLTACAWRSRRRGNMPARTRLRMIRQAWRRAGMVIIAVSSCGEHPYNQRQLINRAFVKTRRDDARVKAKLREGEYM